MKKHPKVSPHPKSWAKYVSLILKPEFRFNSSQKANANAVGIFEYLEGSLRIESLRKFTGF